MIRRHVLTAGALAVAGAVAVAGTPAGPAGRAAAADAPAATAVTTTVPGAPAFDPVDFFTDFFGQINEDPHEPGDLPQRVVAGSPADDFVTYLLGFGAARLDSRQGPLQRFSVQPATTAITGSDAVEVCSDGFCDLFSDFVLTDGRLQSFLLNGLSIDDRLASQGKAAPFGPAEIGVVGGFERVTVDELAVVVAIEPAGEELTVDWDEVSYVDPSGGVIPVDLLASAYPALIAPRADGRAQAVVLQFPTADLGGELALTFTSGASPQPVEVSVPVDESQDGP